VKYHSGQHDDWHLIENQSDWDWLEDLCKESSHIGKSRLAWYSDVPQFPVWVHRSCERCDNGPDVWNLVVLTVEDLKEMLGVV
jgi:hypothetical protein